jgi:hypothetical protein
MGPGCWQHIFLLVSLLSMRAFGGIVKIFDYVEYIGLVWSLYMADLFIVSENFLSAR